MRQARDNSGKICVYELKFNNSFIQENKYPVTDINDTSAADYFIPLRDSTNISSKSD